MRIVLASVLFLIVASTGIDRKRHTSPDIQALIGKRHESLGTESSDEDETWRKSSGTDSSDDFGRRHESSSEADDEKRHEDSGNPHKLSDILRELIGYNQVRDETRGIETATQKFDEEKWEDLEKMFLMPGSYYFFELIHNYCMVNPTLLAPSEIKATFALSESYLKDHCDKMFRVFRDSKNSDGTALMAARYLTKMIFMERMKCPANVIDHALRKMMLRQKTELMKTDHRSMLTYFKTMAPQVDPKLAYYADDLAHWAADTLHGRVFNDTMMFVMAFGLKDVSFTSHNMFHNMKYYLDNTARVGPVGMQNTITQSMKNVSCPTYEDTVLNHQKVFGMFLEKYETMETGTICSTVYDLLLEYIHAHIPGYNPTYTDELKPVCDRIHDWILEVVNTYKVNEAGLYSLDMALLENLLRDSLGDREWETVKAAAIKLGLHP